MTINAENCLISAWQRPSPHWDERPLGVEPRLLVIHNISLPAGCFTGNDIDDLFMGQLDCHKREDYLSLQGLRVSAHCLIRRDGQMIQYVPFHRRAWHAGVSCFQGQSGCNDFSIGIELEGTDTSGFTSKQYQALNFITQSLMERYPQITLGSIVGHSDIAPGRKTDPGIGFDWPRFRSFIMDADK